MRHLQSIAEQISGLAVAVLPGNDRDHNQSAHVLRRRCKTMAIGRRQEFSIVICVMRCQYDATQLDKLSCAGSQSYEMVGVVVESEAWYGRSHNVA